MTPEELVTFTGADGPDVLAQAAAALDMAEGLIAAYCRGRHRRYGHYRQGVESVVTAVAARILANPEQVQAREQVGPYEYYRGQGFSGFTLVELAVLNRYRKRGL